MSGKVVVVAQQKGGSGKTTLCANLAVAWAVLGRPVTVIDIDPQASLGGGFASLRRRALGDDAEPEIIACAGWRLPAQIERASKLGDVIVDSPPHAEAEARAAIRQGDLVIVPCQPSPLDIWASAPTMEFAQKEGVLAVMALTRVPPRGRIVAEARNALEELGAPRLDAEIGSRQAFVAAMGRGLGVVEHDPKSRAAEEVRALAEEVAAMLAEPAARLAG